MAAKICCLCQNGFNILKSRNKTGKWSQLSFETVIERI